MTKQIKDKTLSELTLEDKALIVTARDIYWIKEDLEKEEYNMLFSFITGRYLQYNPETNPNLIEEEFTEMLSSVDLDDDDTTLVSSLLTNHYADYVIDILDKISPKDE